VIAKKGDKSGAATGTMTDDELRSARMAIMREVGFERGSPPSADQIAKAKQLAKEKGLDPDLIAAAMSMPGGRKRGGDGGGGERGSGSRGSSRGGGGGGGGAAGVDRGFNNTIVTRTLYKLADPNAVEKKIEPVSVKLGISDGFYTEVLEGLNEGDTLIKNVTMPGAAPVVAGAPGGGMQNPFQGGRSFSGSSGGMRGPR
jgi:hypothetical protein